MTGILHMFDRYKSKSYAKNESMRSNTGGSETKSLPKHYLVEGDTKVRRAPSYQAWSEVSQDSYRSSSADISEVMVKFSASSIEPHNVQTSCSTARPSIDFLKSSFSTRMPWSPSAVQDEGGDHKETPKGSESYIPEVGVLKYAVPSRSFVGHRSKFKLQAPSRDLRNASKTSAHMDRLRTTIETTAHLDNALYSSRAVLQTRELVRPSFDAREHLRHSPHITRRDSQLYRPSGDEREGASYRRDSHCYQSSGDEKDRHLHMSANDSEEAKRFSSVTVGNGEQVFDDVMDHHRPQFPSEGKEFLRFWPNHERRMNRASNHVKEPAMYMSSGEEVDNKRENILSGGGGGGREWHDYNVRTDSRRHRSSPDPESNRSYWPVGYKDAQRHQSASDTYETSSGNEKIAQGPSSFTRRRRSLTSAHDRGHKGSASNEKGEGRRYRAHVAGRENQGMYSSGHNWRGHRSIASKVTHHDDSSANGSGRKRQSGADLNEHQRFQSAVGAKSGSMKHMPTARVSKNHPSTGVFTGRRYPPSGFDSGACEVFASSEEIDDGEGHDSSVQTFNDWRNEFSDEDREVSLQHIHRSARSDPRRYSSMADAHRRLSLGNDDRRRRHSPSNDDRRLSVKHGRKLESTLDVAGASGQYQLRSMNRTAEWVTGEVNVARSLLVPVAVKEVCRKASSADSRGERRHRASNLSVATQEPVKFRLSADNELSNSKDKGFPFGFSRDLSPKSSARDMPPRSPRDLADNGDFTRLNMQVKENPYPSVLRGAFHGELLKPTMFPEHSQLSSESMTGSYDFREILRPTDFKDSQWGSEKLREGSSRNSTDGRDSPRASNVSRVSVDSRQYQSSTPRLSVDGRELLRPSSLHSSRTSSMDAQAQHRSNSMDSSASWELNRRGPSVVARLMGLPELPVKGTPLPGSDGTQIRKGKSLQKLVSKTPSSETTSSYTDRGRLQLHLTEVAQQMRQVAARLHQDSQLRQKSVQASPAVRPKRKLRTKSKIKSRSRSPPPAPSPAPQAETLILNQHQGYGIVRRQANPESPLPRQPMSPKHHQMEGMPKVINKRPHEFVSGDLDQRLHQLRIENSIQEHRTLKQILEAMHLKGLLHPPQRKPYESPREVLHGQVYLREEEQRPFQELTSSLSNAARTKCREFLKHSTFDDLIRIGSHRQEEPTLDNDNAVEASIVLMKPVNYHSSALDTLPAAIKEVDSNSETSGRAAFEDNNIEVGARARGFERRVGGSGRRSRSNHLETLDQRSADKEQVEDQNFANVVSSWRERIAADEAKKAMVDLSETKSHICPDSAPEKHRSREASPSHYETRDSSSIERKTRSKSSKVESLEESILTNVQELGALSRGVLLDLAQKNCEHDEDRSKIVSCSNPDLQLSASSAEALAALDDSCHEGPARASVLRNKVTSREMSHFKDKHNELHPGVMPKSASPSPVSINLEASCLPAKLDCSFNLDLNAPEMMNLVHDSNVARKSFKSPEVSMRMTPKKRKIAESVIVHGEEFQLPPGVAQKFEVKVPSHEEGNDNTLVDGSKMSQDVSIADSDPEDVKDTKMEDPCSDAAEVHTPDGESFGREKCLFGGGACTLLIDHPSPVSVLDSPIYQEEFQLEEASANPIFLKSSVAKHPDFDDIPHGDEVREGCGNESEIRTSRSRVFKEITDPLRDMYSKLVSTLELSEREISRVQSGADLRIPLAVDTNQTNENAIEVIPGDRSMEKLYVVSILTESGFTREDSEYTEGASDVMHFGVFTNMEEKLQTQELQSIDSGELEKSEELRHKESLDRRLIFDCMNEILERKMKPFLNPQPWVISNVPRKPSGQRLIDEVWDELKDLHWPTRADYDALYAVLQKDFMRKGFQWLDYSVEVVDVGRELERMILQELVEELVQDVISLKSKREKEPCGQLPACPSIPRFSYSPGVSSSLSHLSPTESLHSSSTHSSPASPRAPSEAPSELSQAASEVSAVSSDNSERRRRELLDKTRRDLLAWHVQYQQL